MAPTLAYFSFNGGKEMLVKRVAQLVRQRSLWQPNQRVLVAVSTGVDSMVLLHILQQLDIELGVVHVNHQLRAASQQEEAFLVAYCQQHQLPIYTTHWEQAPKHGMEAAARDFRYAFFKKIMVQEQYDVLVTAHHADDQMETILMKLTREGHFFNSQGIRWTQCFGPGQLVRPLLTTTKAELLDYCEQQQLQYFEDETNASLEMQRNRWRHQIMPFVKLENPQVHQHFQQWSEQVTYAQDIIREQQNQWYQQMLTVTATGISFQLDAYHALSKAQQYFFIQGLGHKQLPISLSEKQIQAIHHMLNQSVAQQTIDLGQQWECRKMYQQVLFQKKVEQLDSAVYHLHVGDALFLSEDEWLGWFQLGSEKIPKKVKDWSEYRQEFTLDYTEPLIVRKRKPGDRIRLTPQLTKRVNRWFIDQKITQVERDRAWMVADIEDNILGIVPHLFSYLSIAKETDKIHYILLYRRK